MSNYILKFDKTQVRQLLDHALSCKQHSPEYEQLFDPAYRKDGKELPEGHWPSIEEIDLQRVPAGLHLVADQDVYFMSNGIPRDIVKGTSRVAYAEGLDPDKDEAWWERKRVVMGGDDTVLFFSAAEIEQGLAASTETLQIGIQNDGISVTETAIYLR